MLNGTTDLKQQWDFLGFEKEAEIRLIDPHREKPPKSIFVHTFEEFKKVVEENDGKYNIYVGINERRQGGTSKPDVISVKTIILDLDSVRDKDTAATEEELQKVIHYSETIQYNLMRDLGIKKPLRVMSGNGVQLYFAIPKIEITDENRDDIEERIKKFHGYVQQRYSNNFCKIDQIGDLPRIIKVLGSTSVKGNNTKERPWRRAYIIDKPFERDEDTELKELLMSYDVTEPEKTTPEPEPLSRKTEEEFNKLLESDKKLRDLYEGRWQKYGYPSRSEAEEGLISKLVLHKFPSEQIAEIMNNAKIGKWQEEKKHYKETQIKAAKKWISENNVELENKLNLIKKAITNFTDYLEMADRFLEVQPIYYDKAKIWWAWNWKESKWEIVDETDIMNLVDKYAKIQGSVNSTTRDKIKEALKRRARLNVPDPFKDTWVQFKDVIIDVESDEIIKAEPKYFTANPVPWKLGDSTETPIMDRIFEEWVGKDYVQTLYEIIAFSTIPKYFIHRFFILTGSGSNGKTSFLKLLTKFLGTDNIATTDLFKLLKSRFETAKLYRKLACVMGETNFSTLTNTGLLKQLTGEDIMGYEFKGKNPFDAYNYAKLIIATNTLPMTTDKTRGFYRRPLIIEFPNEFTEEKDILGEIPDEEYKNLARKCVVLLKKLWKERKFTNEGTIEDRMRKYEEKSNPLTLFISLYCEKDVNASIPFSDFYEQYTAFLTERGYRIQSAKEVGTKLKYEGFDNKSMNTKDEFGNKTTYKAILGLKFNDNNNTDNTDNTDSSTRFPYRKLSGTTYIIGNTDITLDKYSDSPVEMNAEKNTKLADVGADIPTAHHNDKLSSGNEGKNLIFDSATEHSLLEKLRADFRESGELYLAEVKDKLFWLTDDEINYLVEKLKENGELFEKEPGLLARTEFMGGGRQE